MDDQDKTYNTIRRIPLDEMEKKIDIRNFNSFLPPVIAIGDFIADTATYYRRDFEIERWRKKLLNDNGWTLEDLSIALEKRAITNLISDYNSKNKIPPELLNRVKEFFPNARFSQARLDLE